MIKRNVSACGCDIKYYVDKGTSFTVEAKLCVKHQKEAEKKLI